MVARATGLPEAMVTAVVQVAEGSIARAKRQLSGSVAAGNYRDLAKCRAVLDCEATSVWFGLACLWVHVHFCATLLPSLSGTAQPRFCAHTLARTRTHALWLSATSSAAEFLVVYVRLLRVRNRTVGASGISTAQGTATCSSRTRVVLGSASCLARLSPCVNG